MVEHFRPSVFGRSLFLKTTPGRHHNIRKRNPGPHKGRHAESGARRHGYAVPESSHGLRVTPGTPRARVPSDRSRPPRPPARRGLARLRARGARRPRLEATRVAVGPLPLRRPPRLHRPRPPLGPDELHPSEAVSSKCPHRREPPRPPQLLHEVPARLAHAARPQLPPPRPRCQVGADVEELVDVVGRLAVVPPHCRPHRPERAPAAPPSRHFAAPS